MGDVYFLLYVCWLLLLDWAGIFHDLWHIEYWIILFILYLSTCRMRSSPSEFDLDTERITRKIIVIIVYDLNESRMIILKRHIIKPMGRLDEITGRFSRKREYDHYLQLFVYRYRIGLLVFF